MYLYRRKQSPYWSFKFTPRGRKPVRRTTRHTNKKVAARIAQAYYDTYIQRASGATPDVDLDVPAVTLDALTPRYLDFAKNDHAPSADEDARVIARFVEIVGGGETFLHTITASTIDWWRTKRRKDLTRRGTPVSASRVNRELNVIRALFRQAVLWEQLPKNPCAGVKDFKTTGHEVDILTAEELDRAFTLLPEPYNLFCEVTFRTLARLGEVTSLRSDHVHVDLLPDGTKIGTLVKRVKGGKWKRVRIPLALAERLRAQVTRDGQDYVFPDHCNSDAVSARFTILFRAIGLKCSHHAFRHSGITRMLEGGVSPRAIQEHAGWSSLKQLQRYGRVLDQEFARAIEATDDFLVRHRAAKQADAQTKRDALTVIGGGR